MKGSAIRSVGVCLAAAAMYLLVVQASRGTHLLPEGDQGVAIAFPGRALFGLVAGVFAIGVALILVMIVWAAKAKSEGRKPKKKRTWKDYLAYLVGFALILLLFTQFQGLTQVTDAFIPEQDTSTTTTTLLADTATGDGSSTSPIWLVIGALGLGAIVVVLMGRRRPPLPPIDGAGNEDAVPVPVVSDPSELSGLAPREAVIAAALLLETRLGDVGKPRDEAETPEEYARRMRRWLGDRGGPATTVFRNAVHARFSDHVIDEDMRTETIGALDQALAELRAYAVAR